MKLTKVKDKINNLIYSSIYSKCSDKIYDSTSFNIRIKVRDKLWTPDDEILESIENMQRRIINNLKDEIK